MSVINCVLFFFSPEINAKDPELDRIVNIGFPLADQAKAEVREQKNERRWMKTRGALEAAARLRECEYEDE